MGNVQNRSEEDLHKTPEKYGDLRGVGGRGAHKEEGRNKTPNSVV